MPSNTSSKISGGISLLAAILLGVTFGCGKANQLRAGSVLDEAMRANRTPASMPAADEDFFRDMDGGLALTRDEVQGRNMWLVWTGGNDRFSAGNSARSPCTLRFFLTMCSQPTTC